MRVHHLNCISTCPIGGRLMDGRSGASLRGKLALHCLLVEGDRGLTLLDTGLGLRDVADPSSRLSSFFLMLLRPEFREEMTAVRQIEKLGFDPRDVRDIVLTHLDFDHAGGLDDFPEATVHLLAVEQDAALGRKTPIDKARYRPQQWSSKDRWRVYPAVGQTWFGFDAVRGLEGLPPEILFVPLPGHTWGHAGIAVRRDQGWLLYAGDAYFWHDEMDLEHPRCTPGLRFYQWLMDKDRAERIDNQRRLRELKRDHGHEVTIFSGHDPVEFEALAGRPLGTPVGRRDREEKAAVLQPVEAHA